MIKKNSLHAPFVFLDRNVINVCISAVCSDRFNMCIFHFFHCVLV